MSIDSQDFAPGLRIFHGTRLEELTTALAGHLSRVPADPFAEEIIVVPNTGIGDWLQSELPDALGNLATEQRGEPVTGVLANFRFLTTNAFTNLVLRNGRPVSEAPWGRDRLLWFVHRAIDDVGRDTIPGAQKNRLRTADVIADLFDRYATYRPSMLRYWSSGRATDAVVPGSSLPASMQWQAELFRRVRDLIDEESVADALHEWNRRVEDGEVPAGLPHRVSVFGFSSLGPSLRILVDTLAAVRPVDVFILHPVEGPWETDRAGHDRLAARAQNPIDVAGHPLTLRWGRTALETRRLVPHVPIHEVSSGVQSPSLLGSLQSALSGAKAGELMSLEGDEARDRLAHGDGSIQVHACHGRARQVEVLRDALLHRLNADPTLHLDDVLVICPEIESFAPMIPAIFGSDDHRSPDRSSRPMPPLRVRVAELELAEEAPVIDAFDALLTLIRSRIGVVDVLGFLSRPVVMKKFGLDADAVARLIELADNLQVDFGIDGDDRSRWGVPAAMAEGTWRFALTRLMMGLAVATAEPEVGPGGVVPYDDVAVGEAQVFGALAELLERIESTLEFVQKSHSIPEWLRRFEYSVDDFMAAQDAKGGGAELLEIFDDLENAAVASGITADDHFTFEEIDFAIGRHLVGRTHRPLFRTGDITVSRLPPVQGIPYRVIALLGADESMFTQSGSNGDDVLSLQPCLGEPDPAGQGRLGLLNIVMAARDAVIITCEGADINTNKPIPLAVPLQELLEASLPLLEGAPGQCRLLTNHPRQNFHPSVLTKGLVFTDRPFTFDSGSKKAQEGRLTPPTVSTTSRPPRWNDHIDLTELLDAAGDPVSWFAVSAAQIRIDPVIETGTADAVHLQVDPLRQSQLCRDLLEWIRVSPEFRADATLTKSVERWSDVIRRAGLLPPGALADTALSDIIDEVSSFVAAIPHTYFDTSEYRHIDVAVRVPLTEDREVGIGGEVTDIVGNDLVRLLFRRPSETVYLAPALELAVLALAEPSTPYRAVVVTRGMDDDDDIEPVILTIRGESESSRRANAERFVRMALEVAGRARTSLLPIFPRASADLARGRRSKARKSFESDCSYVVGIGYFFGLTSFDDLLNEPVQADDPPGTGTSRLERYAGLVWGTFDETISVDTVPFIAHSPVESRVRDAGGGEP